MGGVKWQLFLQQLSLETGTKNDYQGRVCFKFPEAVVTSKVIESLRSTEHGSLQVLAVL